MISRLAKNEKLFYLIYVIVAFIAFWYWHVDEHYQISEFASYKLGFTPIENMAWEFNAKIRSGILPFFIYLISKISLAINGFHPFLVEAISRVFAALFFVYSYRKFLTAFKEEYAEFSFEKFEIWTILFWLFPIVMVRYSSESVSISFFLLGLYHFTKSKNEKANFIWIGILWGLSFYIRMQMSILIGVYLIWYFLYVKKAWRCYVQVFIGFLIATAVELIANYWLYDAIVWSPYLYFEANVIQGAASSFGVQPWYYYITEFLKNAIYPMSAFILISAFAYCWKFKTSVYTWLILVFVIIHSFISHKEYRFIFSILPILLPISFIGIRIMIKRFPLLKHYFKFLIFLNLLMLSASVLIQSFKPYNYLMLYPKTVKYSEIASYPYDVYSLDTTGRFKNVRAYYWKSPQAKIRVIKNIEDCQQSILVSYHDLGDELKIGNKLYQKNFQTITEGLKEKIPEDMIKTIDQIFIYKLTS